jgi:hypothetical protein
MLIIFDILIHVLVYRTLFFKVVYRTLNKSIQSTKLDLNLLYLRFYLYF